MGTREFTEVLRVVQGRRYREFGFGVVRTLHGDDGHDDADDADDDHDDDGADENGDPYEEEGKEPEPWLSQCDVV